MISVPHVQIAREQKAICQTLNKLQPIPPMGCLFRKIFMDINPSKKETRPPGHTRRGVECYSTDQGTAPHHEYEKEMPRCHRGPRRFYPLLVYECVQ